MFDHILSLILLVVVINRFFEFILNAQPNSADRLVGFSYDKKLNLHAGLGVEDDRVKAEAGGKLEACVWRIWIRYTARLAWINALLQTEIFSIDFKTF